MAEAQKLDFDKIQTIGTEEYARIKGRNHPARLIVRDCHLTEDSIKRLESIDTGLYMTEWKFENGLDRITAAANPRQLERVPAGTKFKFEMVYTVEDENDAIDDLKNLVIALSILQDDALGGHGSRGYGKIRFEDFKFDYRDKNWYRRIPEGGGSPNSREFSSLLDVLKQFGTFRNLLPTDGQQEQKEDGEG